MPGHLQAEPFCVLMNYKSVLSNPDFRAFLFLDTGICCHRGNRYRFSHVAGACTLIPPKVKGFIGRLVKTAFILPMMLCPWRRHIWYIIFACSHHGLVILLFPESRCLHQLFGEIPSGPNLLYYPEFWWGTPMSWSSFWSALDHSPADFWIRRRWRGATSCRYFSM